MKLLFLLPIVFIQCSCSGGDKSDRLDGITDIHKIHDRRYKFFTQNGRETIITEIGFHYRPRVFADVPLGQSAWVEWVELSNGPFPPSYSECKIHVHSISIVNGEISLIVNKPSTPQAEAANPSKNEL